MSETGLLFDHTIALTDLSAAIEFAMGIDHIAIWQPGDDRVLEQVFATTEQLDGEFPFQVWITDTRASEPLSIAQIRQIGQQLHTIILTDSIEIEIAPLYDDGYTMISPDGTLDVIRMDDEVEDEGTLQLNPESRVRYLESVAKLARVAAD